MGRIVPRLPASPQERSMRPSQIPNQIPYSSPKRAVQLQSPKLLLKHRPGPAFVPFKLKPLHPPLLLQPSPAFSDCSPNQLSPTPRNRPAPLQHSAQPLRKMSKLPLSSSGSCHPASPELMKGFNTHSAASNNCAGKVVKSEDTLSSSASKAASAQSLGSSKVLFPSLL